MSDSGTSSAPLPPSASSTPASADSPSCAPSSDRMPQARFAFLGDTARLPYGSKSRRTIARYAAQSAQFLVNEQGCRVPRHRLQHCQRPCP